ncbi:MAG: family 78 glycoside hydrolase catalytic domain [Niabella sp.]
MHLKNLVSIVLTYFILQTLTAQTTVNNLLTENLSNPLGIDAQHPRFSWQLQSDKRNTVQTAYEIQVKKNNEIVWNSGKILSDSSVYISYKGKPLQSRLQYNWQVRVWDNKSKKPSKWSQQSSFYTGIFHPSEWKATWIEAGFKDTVDGPSPLFRKEFASNKTIQSAMVFITSHGMYEASINGKKIGDAVLTPGWTSYNKRLQYQVYDVTNLIKNGNNALGVVLGSGWYRSALAWGNNKNRYGKTLGLLLELQITYKDGSTTTIISDDSWKTATGSIQFSEIYNGEIIDARKEKKGWELPGYNDAGWAKAKLANYSNQHLIANRNEPVKKQEVFKPVKIFTTPKGEKVIDFGQNLVGWATIKVSGKAGDSIIINHAEVLDKDGNFYTENLRAAKCENIYVLNGNGVENFHPHFTWQGFRFIKITNYPGEMLPENVEAIALYSDMKTTGTFTTSNKLVNQLQHNIEWGQRGNFLDVPTDCPQRDERLGWTGDAQAFCRTAAFNMNVHNFFTKWLRDVEADQVDGKVPFVIPNVMGNNSVNSAGWADVVTIAPWQMYLAYGDQLILDSQYNSMKAYVESIRKIAKNDLWNTGSHFGDWLFYRPEDDNDGRAAVTDKYLIAQCFYAHSTQLLINTAAILGKAGDEKEYSDLLTKIKAAFNKEYVTPSGRLVSGTQTAYILVLHFDMLPEALRKQAAERLAENIKGYGYQLTTGFLGTPYLNHVLTKFGYNDIAYKLLLRDKYPSWLYPVTQGATTIWERWDGQKPDGSFQHKWMNSFNHYAYGAIGDWMYRKMAGVDTYEDGAGYKHIKIKPHIGEGFTNVAASLKTYYGTVGNQWEVNDKGITMQSEIPANTRATIWIPETDSNKITEGGKPISQQKNIKVTGVTDNYTTIECGSGKYNFLIIK